MSIDGIKPAVQKLLKRSNRSSKDDLWAYMKELYDVGLSLRRPYEQKWLLNLSFLAGKQYVFYNDSTQLIQQLIHPKGRLRIVDNKILPRFQKQVSRLIRNNPRMSVVPASTDQEDIKAAKIGDKVLKWFWRQHTMRKTIRVLGTWIYSCGNGFLDDRWNPKLGPITTDAKGELRYAGDVDVGIWSPFEVIVPSASLTSMDIEDFPWVMKAKYRPLEWFHSNFKRGKEVAAEQRPIPFVDAGALFGGLTDAKATHKLEGAVWMELRVKPNAEYPKGLYLEGANGIILERKDYPFDSYHLEHFKDIEVPGIFWGMATTEAAIWLQKVWNRQLSDIAEFNRTMARGKWLVPRNSKMEVLPDDSHGQRLLYNPVMGHKPEMMDIKGLPATYQQALEIVSVSLMELYHQHEVTQGTNRSDIRSGEMVALLLEQDDFGNVPTHAIFEESLERVMSRVLRRIQEGYKEQRIVSVTGRDLEHDVFAFTGADLRNNTDVHVAKDSSLPDSKVARQYRIMQNFEKGLYGDPADERTRERVMMMLEDVPSEDVKDIFKESHLDRQNARVENEAIKSQPDVLHLVNPYDGHAVHIEEHRMARKQPDYQRIKRENMELFTTLEVAFEEHVEQHQKFLAQEMAAQDKRMAKVLELRKGVRSGQTGKASSK